MNLAEQTLESPIRIVATEEFPLRDLVTVFTNHEYSTIELVIPETEVRRVKDSFPLNARLASFVEKDQLTLYQTDTTVEQTVLIAQNSTYCLVELEDVTDFVEIQSEDLQTAFEAEYTAVQEGARSLELDIIGWEALLEQLEETVDTATRREFEHLIEAAELENLGALDEYAVAIIAAAQSGALQYDLSKWAKEVGLASKATFSRRKTKLEDQGIIYTEKVPVEVGRPRHRLQLASDIDSVEIQGESIDYARRPQTDDTDSSAETDQESPKTTNEPPVQTDSNSPLAKIEDEVRKAISDN